MKVDEGIKSQENTQIHEASP